MQTELCISLRGRLRLHFKAMAVSMSTKKEGKLRPNFNAVHAPITEKSPEYKTSGRRMNGQHHNIIRLVS